MILWVPSMLQIRKYISESHVSAADKKGDNGNLGTVFHISPLKQCCDPH